MFDDLSKENNLTETNKENGKEKLEEIKNNFNPVVEQAVKPSERHVAPESKGKIEDIFSETDKSNPLNKVEKGKNSIDSGKQEIDEKKDKLKKIFILIAFVIGLVLILGLSYWFIGKLFDNSNQEVVDNNPNNLNIENKEQNNDNIQDNIKNEDVAPPVENNTVTEDPIEKKDVIKDSDNDGLSDDEEQTENNTVTEDPIEKKDVIKDSDNDGLSDDEERIIGTDINNVDTDSDGLFDREEVMVYLTNPLDSDTDKDGYLDGAEVSDGYNPKGEGQLYDANDNI